MPGPQTRGSLTRTISKRYVSEKMTQDFFSPPVLEHIFELRPGHNFTSLILLHCTFVYAGQGRDKKGTSKACVVCVWHGQDAKGCILD